MIYHTNDPQVAQDQVVFRQKDRTDSSTTARRPKTVSSTTRYRVSGPHGRRTQRGVEEVPAIQSEPEKTRGGT